MSGHMLGTRTIMNEGVNGSFEVIFSGSGLTVFGESQCNTDVIDCSCTLTLDSRPINSTIPPPNPSKPQHLFDFKGLPASNHTFRAANCTGFSTLIVDFAVSVPTDYQPLDKGRDRLTDYNYDLTRFKYDGAWEHTLGTWPNIIMAKPKKPGSSLDLTFIGTDLLLVGYRGTLSTAGHLTFSTRIDEKPVPMSPDDDSLSKTFNSTPGGLALPFFTFFETSTLTQTQTGSDRHTISVTLDDIVGDMDFAVVQVVYTTTADSINEAEDSFFSSSIETSATGGPPTVIATPSATLTSSLHSQNPSHNLAGALAGGIIVCAMLLLCSVCLFLKNEQRRRQRLKQVQRRPTPLQSYSTLESANPSLMTECSVDLKPSGRTLSPSSLYGS
jgi:hypothetical protein